MARARHAHLVEEHERIGIVEKLGVVEGVNHSALGEDPPVGVANPLLKLGQVVGAEVDDLGIAQRDETRLEMLGQASGASRRDKPAGAPDRARAPTDRAQLITAVVSTLLIASSWQNPSRIVFTPAESTSVSSVRLPTPIIMCAPG